MRAILRNLAALLRFIPAGDRLRCVLVSLGVSATEGIGLLLLLPLLGLAGIGPLDAGSDRFSRAVASGLATLGLGLTLPVVLGLFVAVTAAKAAFDRFHAVMSAKLEEDTTHGVRVRLYEAVTLAGWEFFVRRRASSLQFAMTSATGRVGGAAYHLLDWLVAASVVGAYLAVALWMSPAITAFVAIAGLVLAVAFKGRLLRARAASDVAIRSNTRMHDVIGEQLSHMKTVRAYGAERESIEAFTIRSARQADLNAGVSREYGHFRQYLAVGSAAGLAGIVYVAVTVVRMPPAPLLLLLFTFARLLPRLTGLYERAQAVVAELPAVEIVLQLEADCRAATTSAPAATSLVNFDREVRFEDVTFSYSGDVAAAAVRGVSLSIAAGTTTALVGASGAGKSTVADLLLGLITPQLGTISIDGRPLDAGALRAWRGQVGYVPQDAILFHDSVGANLRWARPDASDDELWEALRTADAEQFVRGLPDGLQTVVGDRGARVSGGERQRLALARALVRRPRLLLLDEATSSLGAESRARIDAAIERLHHRMTIVVITHRLEGVRNADAICVLDRGEVVQSGSWSALTAAPGSRFTELLAHE